MPFNKKKTNCLFFFQVHNIATYSFWNVQVADSCRHATAESCQETPESSATVLFFLKRVKCTARLGPRPQEAAVEGCIAWCYIRLEAARKKSGKENVKKIKMTKGKKANVVMYKIMANSYNLQLHGTQWHCDIPAMAIQLYYIPPIFSLDFFFFFLGHVFPRPHCCLGYDQLLYETTQGSNKGQARKSMMYWSARRAQDWKTKEKINKKKCIL